MAILQDLKPNWLNKSSQSSLWWSETIRGSNKSKMLPWSSDYEKPPSPWPSWWSQSPPCRYHEGIVLKINCTFLLFLGIILEKRFWEAWVIEVRWNSEPPLELAEFKLNIARFKKVELHLVQFLSRWVRRKNSKRFSVLILRIW